MVGGLGADGFYDGRLGEVVGVGFWGVGIVGGCAHVINVEVAVVGDGAFDGLVAGVLRVFAGAVAAC